LTGNFVVVGLKFSLTTWNVDGVVGMAKTLVNPKEKRTWFDV